MEYQAFSTWIKYIKNQEQKTLDTLFDEILEKYYSYTPKKEQNIEVLQKAFAFGKNIHRNQKRDSGVLYFTHPLIVAQILQEYDTDANILAATLLHDAIEDSEEKGTDQEVREIFGEGIYCLVDGVSKVGKISGHNTNQETLQKIFSHSAHDVRILVIKIADRIHNIATIGTKSGEEKRRKKIDETLEIYVFSAEKLQLNRFNVLLLESCFYYLFPEKFKKLEEEIIEKTPAAKQIFQKISQEISTVNSNIRVEYLPYRVSYLFRRGDADTYDINPSGLFYIDIITESKDGCYQVLSWLSKKYNHKTSLLTDFIANPPENGYRALKTSMVVDSSYLVRFHILTENMDISNQKGIFAHIEKNNYLLPLFSKEGEDEDISNFVEILKNDLLLKKKCIHNPQKGQKYIPIHSRALDAAIHIFPEHFIYLQTILRNGKPIRFNQKIAENDIVECVFSDEIQVDVSWIPFVYSSFGKIQIQKFLKTSEKSVKIDTGRKLIQSVFSNFKEGDGIIQIEKYPAIFSVFGVQNIDELCICVAEGVISSQDLLIQYKKFQQSQPSFVGKIQSFFPNFFSGIKRSQMRFSLTSSSLSLSKIIYLLTKKSEKYSVLPQEISVKNSNTVVTTLSAQKSDNIFSLFSELKSYKDIHKIEFLPPQWFYLKMMTIFMVPLLLNFFVFELFVSVQKFEILFAVVFVLLVFLINAWGYVKFSHYFLLLRKNIFFLSSLFFLNLGVLIVYFIQFFQKAPLFSSASLFLLITTVFASILPSLFLFITAKSHNESIQKISHADWKLASVNKKIGYVLRLIAIIIFGVTPILNKYYLSDFSGLQVTSISFFLAFILILPFVFYRKTKIPFSFSDKKYNTLFWVAVLSDMALIIFYFFSVNFTSASTAITFLNFSPLLALIIGAIFWKNKRSLYMKTPYDFLKISSMFIVGTLGVLLLVVNKSSSGYPHFMLLGDLLAFIAVIFDVIATLALISYTQSKNILKGKDYIISKISIIGALLSPYALYTIYHIQISVLEFSIFLFLAFFNFIVAYLLSYEAYKRLDGLINFLFFNLSVVVTLVIEVCIFDLPITPLFLLGIILVVLSSFFAEYFNSQLEKKQIFHSEK